MQTKKSSNLAIALIWFTAAISMAEILTGTWFAPLGWQQGLIAIVVGHFIGGSMFFCAGYIGAKTQKSAMQTVQISFGEKGSAREVILFYVDTSAVPSTKQINWV